SVYWFEHGWFWLIPLKDGSMSVGAVCRPEYLKQRRAAPAEFLRQTIALAPQEMRQRMRDAVLIDGEARATGNYSYTSSRMRGERYVLVGDAYAFIDPVFSSGVLLGMNSGVLAAEAIDAWLCGERGAKARFRHFERMVRRGVGTFSWFIERFNTPGMRFLLLHPGNPHRVQQAVISLLAGDIFRDIGARWRFRLFRLFYLMFSLKFPRESFRLWLARFRNPRVAFTGGTMPADLER
ncbi:MAG: NAD(P)/FAD-dependent oxidoreductase, partial [Burkholderiales bacterium]